MPATASVIFAAFLLAACTTAQQRRAAENAAVNDQAAREIERICALEGSQREAAMKKFTEDSGFEIYCAEK